MDPAALPRVRIVVSEDEAIRARERAEGLTVAIGDFFELVQSVMRRLPPMTPLRSVPPRKP